MKKCLQKTDFIELLYKEDRVERSLTKELKCTDDGKIIIPSKNIYGYKLYQKSVFAEQSILRKFLLRLQGKSEFVYEYIRNPNTYYIGEFLNIDQIAKRYNENSSIYWNAKHYAHKGAVLTSAGLLPIYDDYCKVVSSDSVFFEDSVIKDCSASEM